MLKTVRPRVLNMMRPCHLLPSGHLVPPPFRIFFVLAGVGGALAWRYYDGQATDMIGAPALPGATNKPTAPPEGFAELQQQLKPIATDLAAVRNTLEQQSAANHDQLTRIKERIPNKASPCFHLLP